MIWKWLSDIVLAVHVVWVAAAILGPLWAWRRPGARVIHLALLWTTLGVTASGFYCPLMVLENTLRLHYDPSTVYAGGFISHYLSRVASWDVSPGHVCAALVGWTALWTAVYAFLWKKGVGSLQRPLDISR